MECIFSYLTYIGTYFRKLTLAEKINCPAQIMSMSREIIKPFLVKLNIIPNKNYFPTGYLMTCDDVLSISFIMHLPCSLAIPIHTYIYEFMLNWEGRYYLFIFRHATDKTNLQFLEWLQSRTEYSKNPKRIPNYGNNVCKLNIVTHLSSGLLYIFGNSIFLRGGRMGQYVFNI